MIKELVEDFETARHICRTRADVINTFRTLNLLRSKTTAAITPKDGKASCTYKAFGYRLTADNYKNMYYLLNEIFIAKEYAFKSLTDEPVIIDCGANIGFSVLYFKSLYPKAKIFAFEPNPHVFSLLQKNMADNKIENVTLFNNALSVKEGEISFFLGGSVGNSLVGSIRKDRGGTDEFKVKSIRLSDFINKLDLKIDLIKMDVEGAEIEIIEDLYQSGHLGKIDQMLVEYHHKINNEKGNLSEFLKKFETSGFDYNIRTNFTVNQAFQDVFLKFYR